MDQMINDLSSADPESRASAHMERAIERANAGEHAAAISDLEEARRIAEEADLPHLFAAALVNEGFVHSLQGDHDAATHLYVEAAELARETDDPERLKIALSNATVEFLAKGNYEMAVVALTEYLDLLPDDDVENRVRALVNRAIAYQGTGERDAATADVDAATSLAVELGDPSLTFWVRMGEGHIYIRDNDPDAALLVFAQAVQLARDTGLSEELRDSVLRLAQVEADAGQGEQAAPHFAEAAALSRASGDQALLAEALRGHGMVSQKTDIDAALDDWREEESIRRTLGQQDYLADCLQAQAEALRSNGRHAEAAPLYDEAIEIYRGLGVAVALAATLQWYAVSLWTNSRAEDALGCAVEAEEVAANAGDSRIRAKALNTAAMCYADLGDDDAAVNALEEAELLCADSKLHTTMVWVLARRAYVLARDLRPAEELVEALRRAHEYGLENDQVSTARAAVRKMVRYIHANVGADYDEPLSAFHTEQLAEIDLYQNGGMPSSYLASAAPAEDLVASTAEAPDGEEGLDEE